MLGRLGFSPWEYGLAFAAPCVGGLVGSRLARRLVNRFGQRRILLITGALRAPWLIGLVFVRPGVAGLLLVIAVEFGMITCFAVFNPVLATHRLRQVPADRITRTLSAWSVAGKAATATVTALWGVLAGVTSPRAAIGIAGLAILVTPFLLPWRDRSQRLREPGAPDPALILPKVR
jgi:MFS-type transporter involved in bile tolerance (Atg22 family)